MKLKFNFGKGVVIATQQRRQPMASDVPGTKDISLEGNGKLLKLVIKEGVGTDTPRPGDEVTIHCEGLTTQWNGVAVHNSGEQGKEITFKVDDGYVIKGINVGVLTMRSNEICRLTCKPAYARRAEGLPPQDPCPVFEVKLLHWKGEDLTAAQDGGILRSILVKGEGASKPNQNATVTAQIKGTHNGRVFDERQLTFCIGYGDEHDIILGVERALKKFKKGEKSILTISPKYGFAEAGSEKFDIPPNAVIIYEVGLVEFSKAVDVWEMTPTQTLEAAEKLKTKGTLLYKSDEVAKALRRYLKASDIIMDLAETDESTEAEASLRRSLYLNCALCQIRLEQWKHALDSCHKVLVMEAQNEKALFRKGQAYFGQQEYVQAVSCFQTVVDLYPSNVSAKNYITKAKHRLKEQKLNVEMVYNGMFQRFSEKDTRKEALEKARGAANNEPIGYWSNDLASGMLSLQQEMEAFGEKMPGRPRKSSGGSGDGSPKLG